MIRRLKSYYNLPITRKDGLALKDMETAFNHISSEIANMPNRASREFNKAEIIVFGGACCVMYLRNRGKTQDIDFYTPDAEVMEAITDSQDTLASDLKQRWPENWVNAEMVGYAMMFSCEDLYSNSIANNVVLYDSEFLKVYAADFKFQLIGKITRAYQIEVQERGNRSGKDLSDALAILDLLVRENGGETFGRSEVQSWYNGSGLEDEEFDFIDEEFHKKYNRNGIKPKPQ